MKLIVATGITGLIVGAVVGYEMGVFAGWSLVSKMHRRSQMQAP